MNCQRTLYCYCIPPIDFWFGALTIRQLINSVEDCFESLERGGIVALQEIAALEVQAKAAFKTIGWEGDIREGPYYFGLPADTEMSIGYILKQDNNGNCFVASPEPLPSLERHAFDMTVTGAEAEGCEV